MISLETTLVPIHSIRVNWQDRYAEGDFNDKHAMTLAANIAQHDLIHSIVIDQDQRLIVGGHRLRAWFINEEANTRCLNPAYENWSLIPARIGCDVSAADLADIELVENIQHRQLPWPVKAIKVAACHASRRCDDPKWPNSSTAALLGISTSEVDTSIRVAQALAQRGPRSETLRSCQSLAAAIAILRREDERKAAADAEEILGLSRTEPSPEPTAEAEAESTAESDSADTTEPPSAVEPSFEPLSKPPVPIQHIDFSTFLDSYHGPRFNLLHCDPPYGKDMDTANAQSGRKDWNTYADTEADYWGFLETLAAFTRCHVSASAHIILWHAVDQYAATLAWLADNMVDWTPWPRPLVWHFSDGAGLCPDPQRRGRNSYEQALVLVRDDRKIVAVRSLSAPFPKKWPNKTHQSEKPFDLLLYWGGMFIDEHTVLLDPTTGSGTMLHAATELGARTVHGLERDQAIHKVACENWYKFRQQQSFDIAV